jgi:hypothetical protein
VNPQQQRYQQGAELVAAWAARIASQKHTVGEVTQEMRKWVGRSMDRVWTLAVSSVGCAKDMMQCAVATHTGGLHVAEQGSWFIKTMEGPGARQPDAVTATQAAIAMLNRDADMVHDLLLAHERAGGPQALFGVALAATRLVATMLDRDAWAVSSAGGLNDERR